MIAARAVRMAMALVAVAALAGCGPPEIRSRTPALVGPKGETSMPAWSAEEREKPVAIREVARTQGTSQHVVRLRGAEPPHVHDRSDLVVFVLAGSVRMNIADRVVPLGPGDVVDVPRGVPHWAENAGDDPGYAYVVFAPPFDPADRRPVGGAAPPPAP